MKAMPVVAVLAILGFSPAASTGLHGVEAYEELKTITGQWQGVTAGGSILRIDYATSARGSVLIETWQPGSAGETLSVMHQDGNRVMATHYCGQGNQPRLVMKSSDGHRFVFEYQDASNLASPEASHLYRLEFAKQADGGLVRIETYRNGKKDETSQVQLTRIRTARTEGTHGP